MFGVDENTLSNKAIEAIQRIEVHPDVGKIEDDDRFLFKLVSSWAEKGTKLYGKRFISLMKVLIGVSVPIGFDDLLKFMEYQNSQKFRELYLHPLIDVGFIKRTIPEKKTSPAQKYAITEDGKLFLGGLSLVSRYKSHKVN